MNYWLVKFAPFRYSWQDVLRYGKFEIYGVRNHQAKNNLLKMKLGDQVFFYHSQEQKQIMGTMVVSKEAHQDKTTTDTTWQSVTFEPVASFQPPVTLEMIRGSSVLKEIALLKQPRLAVMPLCQEKFNILLKMQTDF